MKCEVIKLSALALAVAATSAHADTHQEIDALKQQLKQQQAQIDALAGELESDQSSSARWYDKTTVGGYGEAYFKRIDGLQDEFDAYRLVLFIGHQFNDKVRFGSELEIEHGYVKDTDTDQTCRATDTSGDGFLQASEVVCGTSSVKRTEGYVAVEQLFLEYQYLTNHRVSAGQLLVPVGILNETHEPDTFYGVFRAPVEREIIPGTWFETGLLASGSILPGLTYDAMVSSGLKGGDGKIKDGRQRGSKANGSDLAYTTRVSYSGIPGVQTGLTYHRQNDMSQGTPKVVGEDLDGDLIEAHVAVNKGPFGLRLLAAQWDLNDNALLAADQKRSEQEGWYIEPSWKVTPTVGVFTRYSEWDNESADDSGSKWQETSLGVNWWLDERAVVKADLQRRDDPVAANEDQNGFNVGIGFSF